MNIGWRHGREKARCNILRATAMKSGKNQGNKQAEWGRGMKERKKKGRKKGKLERRWLIRSERWRSRQKWKGKSMEERFRRISKQSWNGKIQYEKSNKNNKKMNRRSWRNLKRMFLEHTIYSTAFTLLCVYTKLCILNRTWKKLSVS